MKKNYAYLVCFRCTEQEFESSSCHGVPLRKCLTDYGYDLSELSFKPGENFLANFHKGRSGFVSTIDKPDSKHIYFFEEWDSDVFLAFCCQTKSGDINVGEFYVTPDKKLHRCSSSRFDKIDSIYSPKDVSKAGLIHLTKIYATDRKIEAPIEGIIEHEEFVADVKKAEKVANNLFIEPEADKTQYVMNNSDLVECMINKTNVIYGFLWKSNNQMFCYPATIRGLSASKIYIDSEASDECFYGEIYRTMEDFLLHSLEQF